ncbi:MAG: OmpH family outer membrane protein [Lentisphaerae bacterium]|nr:OmpH family outer membrane protein [Lentisphaerota bacterium]
MSTDQTQSGSEPAAVRRRRPILWRAGRRRAMALSAGTAFAIFTGAFSSAAGQELRIAVVDLAAVAEKMPEKKDVEARVQTDVEALDREVQSRWKELERLNRDFKTAEETSNAEALAARQKDIIRKEKELGEYWEKRSAEIKRSATDGTGAFSKLIRSSVADMAKQKGFDLVFDKENGRLLYASDRFDRTGDLVEVVNRARGSSLSLQLSAPDAAPAAAPAAGPQRAP